jgi:two-component system sensor histidine kinase YesM
VNKAHKYLPFGYKLMLSYCVFIIIPVLLIGYTANSIFVNSMRQQIRSNIQGTLQQMRDNITYKMDDAVRVSNMLYFDDTLAGHLRHYEEGWISYEAMTKYLLPRLNTTVDTANDDMWLSIYLPNESLSEVYRNYGNSNPLNYGSRTFDIYHSWRITDKFWHKEYPQENYGVTMQWRQIEEDAAFGSISLLRRIVDTANPVALKEIAFMRINVGLAQIFESVRADKIGEGTALYVVDETGQIIISTSTAIHKPGEVLAQDPTNRDLVIREELPGMNWRVVALVPAEITEKDTKKVRAWTFLICAICIIAFMIIGVVVSRYFARRVSKIVSVLDSFQEGDLRRRVRMKGNDEFARISAALNEMGHNIDGLIREIYMTNLQKKELELGLLQAQINPHFLYNTLSSISRLAKFGQEDRLQRMVLDLAKFYRLSLSEGRAVIPIRNELEQAEAYINIQRIKYEDRMNVYYDIDPTILECSTVKFILQPFIENVLEHAWLGDRVSIRIVGRRDGEDIVLEVIDDGVGVPPEVIRQILDPVEGLNIGYGIRNVDQRIRLHFGKEYGVSISSGLGIGTTVRITMPSRQADEA